MNSEKAALRGRMKERAACTDAEKRKTDSAKIAQRLFCLPEWRDAKTVFCFIGCRQEPDTSEIIRNALAQGKTVFVPLCTAAGIMEARMIRDLSELESGKYGIPQPPEASPVLTPEQIELCLVPCLAAARDGTRLGYGGGYYDRFLPQAENAVNILLCRGEFLVQTLPAEEHDIRSNFVLTESETIECN